MWHDMWLRRVADRYHVPPTSLEHLTPGQLEREIAILLADSIHTQAEHIATLKGMEMHSAIHAVRSSGDWYDQIVYELYRQNTSKPKRT